MKRNIRTLFHTALLTLSLSAMSMTAVAQDNGSNSPYSRYGLGNLARRSQGFNTGMAGIGIGLRDGKEVNFQNPAALSAIDSLSFIFDVGASIQHGNLNASGTRVNADNASFDYLTMGFRANSLLGISLNVMPYSTIGYDITTSSTLNPFGTGDVTQTDAYVGEGGLHEISLGAGCRLWRKSPISLGANVGYLWGNIVHANTTSFSDSYINSTYRKYSANIKTYNAKFGLQYEQKVGKNNSFVIGANYTLGHDVNRPAKVINASATSDTLHVKNAFQLPHAFGVGVSWNYGHKLRVGFDWQLQQWKGVRYPYYDIPSSTYSTTTDQFSDHQTYTFGAEYRPLNRGTHWREYIRYRVGASYSTPYAKIGSANGPKDFLISAGVNLPVMNLFGNRSSVNLAVQYERVQPSVVNQIKENYIRLCIGITFNEQWFMKWKVQ